YTYSPRYSFILSPPTLPYLHSFPTRRSSDLRQDRLEKLGVSPQQFSKVEMPYDLQLSTFEGERNLKGINEIKALIGGGFGYAIMMFIFIYGGFVMRSVI